MTPQPQNPPPSSSLPHRFRRSSVERFAKHIAAVVEAFPTAVRLDPRPLALATYCARFRDALISLHKYQWPGFDINMDKFNLIREQITVSERTNGFAYVGAKDMLAFLDQQEATLVADTHLVLDHPGESDIEAVCVLLAHRLLPAQLLPIEVCGGVTDVQIMSLEGRFDVAFEQRGESFFIV
jgi:hypothetical protein